MSDWYSLTTKAKASTELFVNILVAHLGLHNEVEVVYQNALHSNKTNFLTKPQVKLHYKCNCWCDTQGLDNLLITSCAAKNFK